MNERIRQLAKEAGIFYYRKGQLQVDMENFTEVVMEEMYDFIMEEVGNDNGIPDLGKVKQHFGVE